MADAIPEELNAAIQIHQDGQLEEAAQLYQQILDDNPKHADAMHLLGVVRHQQGHHEQSVELITSALTLHPDAANYYSNRADALRMLGLVDEAEADCRQALHLRPDYPDAWHNLGATLLRKKAGPKRKSRSAKLCSDVLIPLAPIQHWVMRCASRGTFEPLWLVTSRP